MLSIKNKIGFESNLYVAEVDASKANSCEEERIKFVTDIASISKGRLGFDDKLPVGINPTTFNTSTDEIKPLISKRRLDLYQRLLTESDNMPSVPFEFIPVQIKMNELSNLTIYNKIHPQDFQNKILKYSYWVYEGNYVLTNMRTLLKAGIKYEDIPYNTPEEVKGFNVILGRLPKVAFDHLVTHREIGRIAESSRNKKYLNEVEFWYSSEWNEAYKNQNILRDTHRLYYLLNEVENKLVKSEDATKELSCRRLMLCAFNGWLQNPNGFENLINVRGLNTGTQSITFKVVDNIKQLTNGN